MPNFLDLPAPVIEQLAKVRLDEDIHYYDEYSQRFRPKRFCFWVLRDLGHPGVHAAAWERGTRWWTTACRKRPGWATRSGAACCWRRGSTSLRRNMRC